MKVLHLTLKKKWFDMILSGEKKEEYREFKDYWLSRLTEDNSYCQMGFDSGYVINAKEFDVVCFKNGYQKNAPSFVIECKGIEVDKGKPEWGAKKDEYCFVIKLGKIIHDVEAYALEFIRKSDLALKDIPF